MSCSQLAKTAAPLANMAVINLVDVDAVPCYTQYLDVSLIPSTLFFFNAQIIKVDWGYVLSHFLHVLCMEPLITTLE